MNKKPTILPTAIKNRLPKRMLLNSFLEHRRGQCSKEVPTSKFTSYERLNSGCSFTSFIFCGNVMEEVPVVDSENEVVNNENKPPTKKMKKRKTYSKKVYLDNIPERSAVVVFDICNRSI